MKKTLVIIGLWVSVCTAQQVENAASSEQLIASPPPDWHRVYQLNTPKTRLSDFVPKGESDTDWTSKLSVESFVTDDEEIDPINLLLHEVEQDKEKCAFVQHFNLFSGLQNAYETSVRLFLCGKNEFVGKGEVKLVKAIRGNGQFYTVRLIRRLPPFSVNEPDFAKEEIAAWSIYVRRVMLCDDTREEHPCPQP